MLRLVLLSSAALVVAALLVGFALPDTWEASRTVTLQEASPAEVARTLGEVEAWPEWSVWSGEGDEGLDVQPVPGGLTWRGGTLGEGALTVERVGADRLEYSLTQGALRSSGEIAWAPTEDGGTLVSWREGGAVAGGPLVRWYAFLSADAIVGGRFEGALARLEARL